MGLTISGWQDLGARVCDGWTSFPACHPEAAESSASPRTPNEGPMQAADSADAAGANGEYRGPSARTNRGPQDDRIFGLSLGKGLEKSFEYVVEFLRVIDEEGVAVAVEALQPELVAEL